MAKYTTELRHIVESGFDIGLNNYPIFDNDYRQGLNAKIISHFWFREIGFETANLFKYFLNRTMNELMPYYNKLYEAELIHFNPLETRNFIEIYKRNQIENLKSLTDSTVVNDTESLVTSEADSTQNDRKVYSDTPQGLLALQNIEGELYATNANIDKSTQNATSDTNTESTSSASSDTKVESDNTTNEDYRRSIIGYEGNPSDLIQKYRNSIINIDMMLIDELDELFMRLY